MVDERREFKRINVNIIPDELYPIGGAEILHKKGHIVNLSAGGAAIESKESFKVGDNVYLIFKLPNGLKLKEVYAHIIRAEELQDGYSLGLRFININESDRDAIKQFTSGEAISAVEVLKKVDLRTIKPVSRRKKEKGIYKTAFRKPKRNKEFMEAIQSGADVNELMDRFGLSESGISMLKKRLMKRDTAFRAMERKFRNFDLKKSRKLRRMTQEDLAKAVGVRRETITRWEKGLFEPSSSYKWKLIKILSARKQKNKT